MFGGGREPSEEEEELGTDEEDYWTGGRNPKVLENVFQGGIAGSDFIWVGYIGAEPLHGTSTGNFPAQCRQENNWEATEETGGGGLAVPTAGHINGGDGFLGYGSLCLKEA